MYTVDVKEYIVDEASSKRLEVILSSVRVFSSNIGYCKDALLRIKLLLLTVGTAPLAAMEKLWFVLACSTY